MKIGILGTGAYGISLALSFLENTKDITMWTKIEQEYQTLSETRRHPTALPGITIPTEITITHNMEEADELCHRIALLNKGHIVESGSPEALKLKYAGKKVVITTGQKKTEVPLEKGCIIKALEQAEDLLMIHSEEPSLRDVFLTLTKEEA